MAAYRHSVTAVALTTAAATASEATILWVNAAFSKLTGYAAESVVGHSAVRLGGARPDVIYMREIELFLSHRADMSLGLVATKQRPDGSWYNVEERLVPLSDSGGDVAHYLVCQRELVIDDERVPAAPQSETRWRVGADARSASQRTRLISTESRVA
jgi:PAS domain S-box-containing protein